MKKKTKSSKEKLEEAISDLTDQIAEQALFILDFDDVFNNLSINEIKNEKDVTTKVSKLFHLFVERLSASRQPKKNSSDIDFQQFLVSITKIYPKAPKDINKLLKWIPCKLKENKENQNQNNILSKVDDKKGQKDHKDQKDQDLRKELDFLKQKSLFFTKSISNLREGFEKMNEQPQELQEEVKQLKQTNQSLFEQLSTIKTQNKILKHKLSKITPPAKQICASIQTQISESDCEKIDTTADRFEIVLCELKSLRAEKQRAEENYLKGVERLSDAENKIRNLQIEKDTLQAKVNDLNNMLTLKSEELAHITGKSEKLSLQCLRLETQIAKLNDKAHLQSNESHEEQVTKQSQAIFKFNYNQNNDAH